MDICRIFLNDVSEKPGLDRTITSQTATELKVGRHVDVSDSDGPKVAWYLRKYVSSRAD